MANYIGKPWICFKHLQSKSGKTLFSSFELDMEEKYLFKISAFSMDSYDNLKSFCGSERGGVSLDDRPVSLLSCLSKILEKIVYKQIYNHLHINKL
jgi:hypothetical protein